jgi:chromosomal replication initiator protein
MFAKQILTNDFKALIDKTISKHLNSNVDVVFQIINDPTSPTTPFVVSNVNNLNKNYTFDNFVVTDFNKTAYHAAQSIFKQNHWNPIFISGGVGLGKTHLLHAIGNEYSKLYPDKKVRYVMIDEFIREVYSALIGGGLVVENIKYKYHQFDLLLIDDIQFLSKKEKIQEIFFNIFNFNINNNTTLVMTSDKAPNHLENFENRMKSRFSSGLTIKIEKPDLNSITKILEEKIKDIGDGFVLTKDAVAYIVRRNIRDIRQLEGYLHLILFFAVNNLPPHAIIGVDIIQQCVEQENDASAKEMGYDVDPNLVIEQISKAYNVKSDLVKSKLRTKQITLVRHICMHALRHKFNMPFEQIGSFFQRDHTTVIEGINKIDNILKKDDGLKAFIFQLYKKI